MRSQILCEWCHKCVTKFRPVPRRCRGQKEKHALANSGSSGNQHCEEWRTQNSDSNYYYYRVLSDRYETRRQQTEHTQSSAELGSIQESTPVVVHRLECCLSASTHQRHATSSTLVICRHTLHFIHSYDNKRSVNRLRLSQRRTW